MRCTSFLLLVFCLHLSAKTSSQSITFSGKNMPLAKVFDVVEQQTGYVVFRSKTIFGNTRPVSLEVSNMPLRVFLDSALKNQPVAYQIEDKTISLSRREMPVPPVAAQPVTGTVVDSLGTPFQGATVRLLPGNKGTGTGADGSFVINGVQPGRYTLQVSFVGHATIRLNITVGDAPFAAGVLVLKQSADAIAEVTVVSTGYQSISRERATGAYATVTAEDFKQQRLSNLNSLLEGRIAGYNKGLVRGTTSMRGVTNPLYVVDGLPVEDTRLDASGSPVGAIPGLNLEDIANITVLKDAAAASIYGARAANGVIVITTKRARSGKPQVSASATLTYLPNYLYTDRITNSAGIVGLEREWAAANPALQDAGAADYARSVLENAVYTSQGMQSVLQYYAGDISEADMNSKLNALAANGLSYYDDLKKYTQRNQLYQQYNVSAGNSTEKNSIYASVTYRNNALQEKYNKDQSLGFNLKNSTQIAKWLKLDLGSYISYGTVQQQSYNPLSPGFNYMAYDRLKNADGSNFTSTAESRLNANDLAIINQYGLYSMDITPLDELRRNLMNSKEFSTRNYAKLDVKFTNWLNYQSSFQYEFGTIRSEQLRDKNSYAVRSRVNSFAEDSPVDGLVYNLPYGNIYETGNQYLNAYNFRQQLNFDKTFGGKHNLVAIAGMEIRNSKLEQASQTQYNYDPAALTYELIDAKKLANATGTFFNGSFNNYDVGTQYENINRFVSFYGNAAYTYNDKYLLSGSLRWDRSNLWGTNSKYQNKPLWSVGAGWNVNRESYFDVAWIDMLKLRASYGIGGNIAKDAAPYMTAYYNPNYTVGGVQGTIASRPNPMLSWEKTTTINVGTDFSLFNQRLSGSLDYYNKQGKDLLANTMGVPTEGFGYATYPINNGAMRNQGVEVMLKGDIIRNGDLNWDASVMFAHNRNKVTYVNAEAPVYFLQLDYPMAYPRIGNPYNAIYAYRWAGLSETGLPQVYDETKTKSILQPTSLSSLIYAGTTVPVYNGSFTSSLGYKNFNLSFLLTFEGGHRVRNTDLPILKNEYSTGVYSYITSLNNINSRINDRWKQPGDEARTNIPKALFAEDPDFNYDSYPVYANADINVLDAANLALRNISLSYNLPSGLSKKMAVRNVRMQFNVENLFMLTRSKEAKYMLGGYRAPGYVWGLYLDL